MSIWIDKKYINMCSNRFEQFSWKSEKVANLRCPFCGDSKKDKTKTRGYLYPSKQNYIYKCHNCGISCGMKKLIGDIDENLCKQYNMELFRERYNVREDLSAESLFVKAPHHPMPKKSFDFGTPVLSIEDKEHPAIQYLVSRGFSNQQMKHFYWCEDFSTLASEINPETRHTHKESRLVVPIYNREKNLLAVQGRIIDSKLKKSLRYLTERVPSEEHINEQLVFGIDRVDLKKTIYICEGVYDSLCIDNGVAFLGVSTVTNIPTDLADKDLVFVLDNEPRNISVTQIYKMLVETGRKIVIWPSSLHEKDINDMVLKYGKQKVMEIIQENTFVNLSADLAFRKWRIT